MATPFYKQEFTFTNPDGTEIQVLGSGNQFHAVFETPDGFTVTKDPETGFWQYARLSDSGDELLPTGVNVNGGDPPSDLEVERGLRLPPAAARQLAQARAGAEPPSRWRQRRLEKRAVLRGISPLTRAAAGPLPAGTVGTYVGLCLLIEFPDVPATITQAEVDKFCNLAGYTGFGNHGSVRDYFHDVSDGKLTYTNVVAPYYKAAHNRAYYTDPAIPYTQRARELIREALDHLVASGFNFSSLSSDGGGYVYALNVFYAQTRVNNWSEGLWPHSSGLGSPYAVAGGKKFSDYQFTDMGPQLSLGTFCHENGHMICDFPDLYDYGSESLGAGGYSLMAYYGDTKNPVQVDAYLKNEAGWTTKLTPVGSGTATIKAGQNDFYIHALSTTEYFIIENRQKVGRDASLPDAGLAIWHVDEAGSNNNEQMTPAQHYECSIEQADGHFDIEHKTNSGDAQDLFGGPGAPRFASDTTPNSNWWNGAVSGLTIDEISAPGPTMTFKTGDSDLVIGNFGYSAGGWRVERHPRFLADTTGDHRADIVGFGDAGVYVSRAQADGTFTPAQLVVGNFGYSAGGWRVERHVRLLADTTGDGRADIVGFGDAGVYVSRAQANGTFAQPQLVIGNFAYAAGGWRVERHPRFLADTTGDGLADIVGFGDAGVYVSRAQANGTFGPAQLVVGDFGASAGGWRVDRHPRFLADTTGDGRADIVGFGDAGVYVSRAQANGTFAPPQLVVGNFGYSAGGWRVERHVRLMADTTGDGRADIVGFGDAGVYVSRAQANGTFTPAQLVVGNFAYTAGGWRVDRHVRLMADTTADGRADIVGFGDAGVYVSRAQANATFGPAQYVVANFGYTRGSWRVERHPRFLADTTGDGRADIVGFGEAGVWVSRAQVNGTFSA